VVLATLEAFMRAYLNVRKVYTYPAAGYIIFNLCSIACVVLLHKQFSVGAVATGLLGGLFLQDVYLIIRLLKYQPFKRFSTSIITHETGNFVSVASTLVVIELIRGFYFLIDRYFAPQFGEGVISALNYSQVLVQLPESVVGFAIGVVLFPIFSSSQVAADHTRFVSVYRKAIGASLFIAVPMAALFFINAEELVRLVYQRGVFDQNSAMITVSVLRPYTPTIIALFIISTSIRACYAAGWSRAVLFLALTALVVKFTATALLSRWLGYPGISAATSLAFVGYGAGLLVYLTRRPQVPGGRTFIWLLTRILLAGGMSLIVVNFLKNRFGMDMSGTGYFDDLLMFSVWAVAFAFLYAGFALCLGLKPFFTELIWNRHRKQSKQ
ncbi:MAG: lipid II flippase MurJ, partial [candidate division Zixibacteria bacterium]|nr:lipid II flippase MurJ [candidate division Zixibacteria bacterium]